MKHNGLFWLINTAGWFTFLLCTGLFFAYLSGNLTSHTLLIQTFVFCYYLPISGLLRRWINQMGWFVKRSYLKQLPLLLLIALVLALTGQFLLSLFMMYGLGIMTWENYSVPVLLISTAQNWMVLCLWILLYLIIKQLRINRQQQLHQLQLQATARESELLALKAQLNPHFIFNCLNNMRALAIDDGLTTRKMITHLSEMLKYHFEHNENSQVTVARELEHIRNYLALETIQLEERLRYDFQVEDSLLAAKIPVLSIQLLVENAIKHGIMQQPNGGHIEVVIQNQGNQLLIGVSNDGSLATNNETTGIGLKNLRQRLNLMYGPEAAYSLKTTANDRIKAEISLPLEYAHD